MDDLRAEGKWDQIKGHVKEAWGDLTDDDLDRTDGKRDRLVGAIKERTGDAVEVIEDKLRSILDRVKS